MSEQKIALSKPNSKRWPRKRNPMDNTELARIAYDAYRDHTGGVSLPTGQPIPQWPQLRPEIQAAWQASADAVKMTEPKDGFWGGIAARMQIERNKARTEIERLRGCVISAMIDFQHGLDGTAKAKLSLLLDGIMKTPRNNEDRLLAEADRIAKEAPNG